MSMTGHPSIALPTTEDVNRWKLELDRVVTEESDMKARHAAEEKALRDRRTRLEKLVMAGAAFVEVTLSESQKPEPAPLSVVAPSSAQTPKPKVARRRQRRKQTSRSRARTWTATILKTLKVAGRGMTYAELKSEMAKTHLGETLSRTDRALYGGVGKLANRGQLVKHNGRLFTPDAYRRFMSDVATGKAVDRPAPPTGNRGSPNKVAIFTFLASRPGGATTAEIVHALLNDPPPGLKISENPTVIYNLLSNLKKRRELMRPGDRYFLPSPDNGAPGPNGPGDPSHHDAGGGTLASSGNGRL